MKQTKTIAQTLIDLNNQGKNKQARKIADKYLKNTNK